jgi:hypothetical protein
MSDKNSKVVNGFSGPFKLKLFKKHDKSSEHQKCVAAKKALTSPVLHLYYMYEENRQKNV